MEYKNSKTANRRRYKSRYHSPHNYKTKRSKSENRAAVLVAVATFLVIASLVLVFTFGDNIYTFVDNILRPPVAATEAPTQPSTEDVQAAASEAQATEAPAQPPTEAPTRPPVEQSAEFTRLLSAAGLDYAYLNGTQMIFVESSGTSATVYTYEKDQNGVWQQKLDPMQGYVGSGGVAEFVGPYDESTPKGTYNIEYAMGTNGDPGTALTYYQLYYGMRWITDPSSINYNRMVDGDATYIDFDDCQWLHEYTISYPYAVVFDYNRNPVDRTQGCAKFLHVSGGPTNGGVGIPQDSLRSIVLWLDPNAFPTISIF